MNLILISGILIVIVIIVIFVLKNKSLSEENKNENQQQTEQQNQQTEQQNQTEQEQDEQDEQQNQTEQEQDEQDEQQNQTEQQNQQQDEEIAPKELSQAEILKAQIMEEVLQEQKDNFNKELEEYKYIPYGIIDKDITGNITKYYNIVNNNDNNFKPDDKISQFKLFKYTNSQIFRIIIPAYNPTNGSYFIYHNVLFISLDNLELFIKCLKEQLDNMGIEGYAITNDGEIKEGYLLFPTYTNTSTPSYQYNKLMKNIQYKMIFITNTKEINDSTLIYMCQDENSKIKNIIDKLKNDNPPKINIAGFNIESYYINTDNYDEFKKYIELLN